MRAGFARAEVPAAHLEHAVQQYLTMLGSTVLIPFIIVPPMGGNDDDLARVIGSIFFISGESCRWQTEGVSVAQSNLTWRVCRHHHTRADDHRRQVSADPAAGFGSVSGRH